VLREKAIWRLNCDWHETIGWTEPITTVDLTVRGGKLYMNVEWKIHASYCKMHDKEGMQINNTALRESSRCWRRL
jgi:hypothetical protein